MKSLILNKKQTLNLFILILLFLLAILLIIPQNKTKESTQTFNPINTTENYTADLTLSLIHIFPSSTISPSLTTMILSQSLIVDNL